MHFEAKISVLNVVSAVASIFFDAFQNADSKLFEAKIFSNVVEQNAVASMLIF